MALLVDILPLQILHGAARACFASLHQTDNYTVEYVMAAV